MKRQTSIEDVRNVAISLLYVDIVPTRISFIATHPFTDAWDVAIPKEKDSKIAVEFLDLRNEEQRKEWRSYKKKKIEKASLIEILLMLNKPYILTFLKFAKGYISNKDLGECLHCSWKSIENISTDVNVSGSELVAMFKRADRDTLMDKEEAKFYESLPDTVTIYRGVTKVNRTNQKALSWTLDYERAVWFANRYRDYEKEQAIHEVWKLNVPKERILATFTTDGKDNEGKVVVNLYRGKFEIERESV